MPDTYEKDLSSKSSLTANDYVRIVGADNESYKQKISSLSAVILPNVTSSDAGKFLRVNTSGLWVAEVVSNAESEEY